MMRALTLIFLNLFFVHLSANAGFGGIAGGTEKYQKGSQINFQKYSTFVNALYSRTLCHDGHDYHAKITKCAVWSNDDDRTCLEREKIEAVQPMESKRFRCKKKEDDDCVEWIEVDFIQSPKRIIELKDDDGNIKKIEKVVIPQCH